MKAGTVFSDMILYGVSFHNAVAYNAMYGTE